MKLYTIERKGFMFYSYIIRDTTQNIIYEGKTRGIRKRIELSSRTNWPALTARKIFALGGIKVDIYKLGVLTAKLHSKLTLGGYNIEIQTGNETLVANGNFFGKAFVISNSREEICKVSIKRENFQRKYGVVIVESADQELILGIIIGIELIKRIKKSRRA